MALRLHNQIGCHDVEIPNAIGLDIARHTLVGTKTLQRIGIGVSFPPLTELCILIDANGVEVCRGQSVGIGLYEMPISILYPKVGNQVTSMLSAESNSVVHYGLGHLRLAHINKHDLRGIVQQGLLKDIKLTDLDHNLFCTGCAVGKA